MIHKQNSITQLPNIYFYLNDRQTLLPTIRKLKYI